MVRGKNEYLYGSVRAEMVVKVEASEKRVNLQIRTYRTSDRQYEPIIINKFNLLGRLRDLLLSASIACIHV